MQRAVLFVLPVLVATPVIAMDTHEDVTQTIATFKKKDPGIDKFFQEAVGYAVFPTVGKGAIGIGGAHGSGELLTGGKAIGKVSLNQVTVGLQLGGQSYSEIIFFETQKTFDSFKSGDFAFAAQASAVALASGAAANAAYRGGVAVFTAAKGGLMYEASIGGQKFSFKPYE
ncbi:MAG TPA: YSC84-related protein [Gemmatimonadales bacterium]|nr:YSC84-related protein [Gemmatimonadales bacterium]